MTATAAPSCPAPRETHSRLTARIIGLVICLVCLSVLFTAAWLRPDGAGHSTHTQLGMQPCGLLARTGIPCPTCGMTTAFAHAANGNLFRSFITQPGGAALALFTAMTALVTGYVAVTGVNLIPWLRPFTSKTTLWAVFAFFLVAWIYKIIITAGVG